jgi:hypothetical protein
MRHFPVNATSIRSVVTHSMVANRDVLNAGGVARPLAESDEQLRIVVNGKAVN